jgi:hypothetical protein
MKPVALMSVPATLLAQLVITEAGLRAWKAC